MIDTGSRPVVYFKLLRFFINLLYLSSPSWSTVLAFFFIISRNSGNSMVPFPSRSTSITMLFNSSSVGFCPIALITPRSSLEEIAPLPSWAPKTFCFMIYYNFNGAKVPPCSSWDTGTVVPFVGVIPRRTFFVNITHRPKN